LKADCPGLEIVINGGILTLDGAKAQLARVDGAMIGRAAYQDPWMLAAADRAIFGEPGPGPSRDEVIERVAVYAEAHLAAGGRLSEVTRHVLGLFQGVPGARAWRRHLSENAHKPGAGLEVLFEAAAKVPAEIRSARAGEEAALSGSR
jgi:tRNA-dihydrouridine synthase A